MRRVAPDNPREALSSGIEALIERAEDRSALRDQRPVGQSEKHADRRQRHAGANMPVRRGSERPSGQEIDATHQPERQHAAREETHARRPAIEHTLAGADGVAEAHHRMRQPARIAEPPIEHIAEGQRCHCDHSAIHARSASTKSWLCSGFCVASRT
ncbi:MAG: hypothetical protein BWX86_02626 [Verrucomicrobia bacterium ADurb.Bin122]|nr:MAG: hypothetical protein BWX86_02626 [Verrucomicrobia bacterium ADurb.Bin122]